ncbi:MAG: PIN domain protein [Bacteroidetes bacterium]|nr:PIN domain protein [Bacteroidota bacterium]MBU2584039.1 PIN domain protein [Bacteroidota bacterium]
MTYKLIPRIYVDTSVFGGCFDPEFKIYSEKLFKDVHLGKKRIVLSDLLRFELEEAPSYVKTLLNELPIEFIENVAMSEESVFLAEAYLRDLALSSKSLMDARHIAIATIEKVDVLVSWNFKHIVNLRRINLRASLIPKK